jgi:hypothetical protein
MKPWLKAWVKYYVPAIDAFVLYVVIEHLVRFE